ncbi:hypothetical protein, partial [Mycobacterium asiaticum]|uniref:hypothetical protein n=1 Tax=Mycobacterium asiaticum TaxID=1790 RepID=UPI000AEBD6FE
RTWANWLRISWLLPRPPLELPTIQIGPLMTDDDVQAWGDMLHLRALLDELHNLCIDTGGRIDTVPVEAQRFSDAWFKHWPEDEAAALLAAWREGVAA